MPTVLAASTISVPAGTVTLYPSIVRLMSGMDQRGSHIARVPQAVVFVLLAEVAHRRLDDPAGRVAQAAQAASVLQAVGDALEDAALQPRPFVGQDAVVRPHGPVATDAAWRALAARLECVEAQQARGRFDH